jgi:hypothetical protein
MWSWICKERRIGEGVLAFDYKAQQLRARRGLIKALLWLHSQLP